MTGASKPGEGSTRSLEKKGCDMTATSAGQGARSRFGTPMARSGTLRRPFGAAAAVAALLVLNACGGAARGTADDTPQGPLDEEVQALAFAECMRGNGVDMPDPAPGQGGLRGALHGIEDNYDPETIEQAVAACQDLLPQRAHEGGHDRAREEVELALAECLREQGLDVPDNLFEGGGLHDVQDEELRAAMEECRDVVAGGDHG
jgi:hypothetical protein